jgi:hypothetical protein
MPYTEEQGGLLNNFAKEPKVYEAEPPTAKEKRNYVFLSIAAMALVSGLIFVAVSASNVG